MTLRNKLATFGTLAVIATTPVTTQILVDKIVGDSYHMKARPQIQPWVWIYDKNQDGEADSVMEGFVGFNGIKAGCSRKPTEEEKSWYKNN